jgi:DNA helicase-2/ATP-dependent DNA helicase PcrA
LFSCVFIGEVSGKVVVAYKPHPAQALHQLDGYKLAEVMKHKRKLWEQWGGLTHSDAALWASKILEHGVFGPTVRGEIIRRFPLIIVDELQDTGYFLGKSILLLLGELAARGVLVGDPDQAIYEFSGARPDLFNRFESISGAIPLPLASSQRCPLAVATAAGHLKDSLGTIGPANGKTGRAFLVRYTDMVGDIRRILVAIAAATSAATVKVVARQTSTVEALLGRRAKPLQKLGCPPLNHMQRGVVAFRQGQQIRALASARAALEAVVFKHEGVTDEKLEDNNIDPREWKALAVQCLFRADGVATTGTQFDWQTAVGKILDEEIEGFLPRGSFQFAIGRLKPKQLEGYDADCADYFPRVESSVPGLSDVPVGTVHSVKGETHDVTVFVCPETRLARCPSVVWWSTDDEDREEKRIAYVAMTRTQGDLIVCVSDDCYARLCTSRSPFVQSFECMTVNEYVAAVGQASVTQTSVGEAGGST